MLSRMKCGGAIADETKHGEEAEKKKDQFVRIDPSWSSEAGD